jgi:uncharacterized membrane protein YcaP (DUF421 family)
MRLAAIALRVLFAYVFVLAMVRASGKRTLAEGTPMDFLVSLILGDLFDDLFWSEVPASEFVVAVGILLMMHTLTRAVVARWHAFADFVEGRERPIVEEGELAEAGMRAERFNRNDVMVLLRHHGEKDLRVIKTAELELNGRASVQRYDWAHEAQRCDRDALGGALGNR